MKAASKKITLRRKQDQVLAKLDDGPEEPVKIVWARPVTGRGREISLIGENHKEVMILDSLDEFDDVSRRIAVEELGRRYLVPRITRVIKTEARFGNRYWQVETDCGPCRFLIQDPNANIIWITAERLLMRDTCGNRYEIESLAALDPRSRAEVERVI